jgi:hypothetical protein
VGIASPSPPTGSSRIDRGNTGHVRGSVMPYSFWTGLSLRLFFTSSGRSSLSVIQIQNQVTISTKAKAKKTSLLMPS